MAAAWPRSCGGFLASVAGRADDRWDLKQAGLESEESLYPGLAVPG